MNADTAARGAHQHPPGRTDGAVAVEGLTENGRLAVKFHEPFKTGDVDALDGSLHPVWVNRPRNPQEGSSPEGFKGTIRYLRSVFPALAIVPEEPIEAGDKVITRSVGTGTQRSEFLGLPATGKRMHFRAIDVHRFEDGRIVESWHLQDYYAMLAQLGAIANVMADQIDPYPGWR